ncbi:MAG: NUDIX hydrolase [Clostridia bacterium]|jgi:ADP-ribose pyrophosphatase|nr:NUDIX hydrolase [Clostridia bacterium]MDH7572684.1 NUDIX hydrolase [Clostridia bacterium]
MVGEEKTLESTRVFSGRVIGVRVDRVRLPDGRESTREVVEHRGAVVIAALNDRQEVMLVRQFRKPVEAVLWELPAGTLEEGEEPLACARRELKEETGLEAEEWVPVTQFYSSPGFCNERLHLFWAGRLRQGKAATDADENLTGHWVPLEEALEMARRGEIADAKTLVGLLSLRYWRR